MASLLICADIFGVTPQLMEWATELNLNGEIMLIDAYDSSFNFADEGSAYTKFVDCGGIDPFVDKISLSIEQHQPSVVLGFSAGAAGAYKALSLFKNQQYVHSMVGFYPSQIRYFTELNPKIDCKLYFPDSESHFLIEEVIDELQKYENVECRKTKYKHGFMNPMSGNYSPQGYIEFTDLLKNKLQAILV